MKSTLQRFAFGNAKRILKKKRQVRPSSTHSVVQKKRKVKEYFESFDVIIGKRETTRTLILGTAPSRKSRGKDLSPKDEFYRGNTSCEQYYGNPRNTFWNIVGTALNFERDRTSYENWKDALRQNNFALWDVLKSCESTGSLDSQIDKNSMVSNDIPGLISSCPNLNRLVLSNNSLQVFVKQFRNWLLTGKHARLHSTRVRFVVQKGRPHTVRTWKFFGNTDSKRKRGFDAVHLVDTIPKSTSKLERVVEIVALPSTSPAYSAMRPPTKEKEWHQGCFGFETSPPKFYLCPCCGSVGKHWVSDCKLYIEAKEKRVLFPKESELYDAKSGGKGYWYR